MGFHDDWIMRQIEMMTRFFSQIIFQKDKIGYEFETSEMLTVADQTHLDLQKLVIEGRICEAEDLLFNNAEMTDKYLELAIDFYKQLNELSDERLISCNFSREEIYEGLVDILEKLGVPVEQFKR